MHEEYLEELLIEHRKHFYLYPAERIEQRIYEEKLRADLAESSFVYFEIPINQLILPEHLNSKGFSIWQVLLEFIASEVRGSDIKGLNETKDHLCFLLLDSDLQAKQNFFNRLEICLKEAGLEKYLPPIEELSHNTFMYTGRTSSRIH